jgi:phospholipid/cholesterol/gamma-HCH transport system substrate-binding protein
MSRRIHRGHLVASICLLGIFALTIAYLYGGILGSSITQRPSHVTVELQRTGGLFEGSSVTYRGVRVGSVDTMRTAGDHVAASITLEPSARVPADSRAAVRSLSPAGEQYLDFQPGADRGPWLEDGATVAASRTSTPTSVATALRAVDDLMSQVDSKDLTTVLDELHAAFGDPDDLGRTVTSASSILDTLDERWPETLRTLRNGRTVLRTGVDETDQLEQLAASASSLTASLEDYDPELRRILDRSPAQIEEFRALTADVADQLPTLLDDADELTSLAAARDQHLRALLQTFPRGLSRLADAIAGGHLRVNMLVSPGEVCSYGVMAPSPRSTERRPVVPGRTCGAGFAGQQRGSAHVPAAER